MAIDLSDLANKYAKPNPSAIPLPKKGLDLSDLANKYVKQKPVDTQPKKRNLWDYGAMAVRGASAFAPGGPVGAVVSGAGEFAGQWMEGRPKFNWPQIATQAGIGAIPFAKSASLLSGAMKGGTLGATSALATQQAEKGLHVPTVDDIKEAAIPTVIGAGTGGLFGARGSKSAPTVNTKTTTPPVDLNTPQGKLLAAIKLAKPARKLQNELYSKERGSRVQEMMEKRKTTYGQAGFYAEKELLKGELPKVDDFEPIQSKFTQDDLDQLFEQAKNHPKLRPFEDVRARDGLMKMLTGKVPQKSEMKLMKTVYGKQLVDELNKKMPMMDRLQGNFIDALNIPRSLMSSFDFSAPFRQGIFMVGRKQFWTSFDDMFKSFGSDKSFRAVQDNITSNPRYDLAHKSKLALTDMVDDMEEAYMSSWAQKMPGSNSNITVVKGLSKAYNKTVGRGVTASGRAYTAFLNKLRMDTFSDLVDKAEKLGIDVENPQWSGELAKYINAATGRASLGKAEDSAKILNTILFSPRLAASRVSLLTKLAQPSFYTKQDKFLRKQYLRDLFSTAGFVSTTLGLGAAAGADIEMDPRNSDFGKIRIGDTRVDVAGGFQQYVKLASQLATNIRISPTTGKTTVLGGKYNAPTRKDVLYEFLELKEAPVISFGTTLMEGKDPEDRRKDVSVTKEIANRLTPMMVQDARELLAEDPSLWPLIMPGLFGASTNTFGRR